jgi:hypothetical protein
MLLATDSLDPCQQGLWGLSYGESTPNLGEHYVYGWVLTHDQAFYAYGNQPIIVEPFNPNLHGFQDLDMKTFPMTCYLMKHHTDDGDRAFYCITTCPRFVGTPNSKQQFIDRHVDSLLLRASLTCLGISSSPQLYRFQRSDDQTSPPTIPKPMSQPRGVSFGLALAFACLLLTVDVRTSVVTSNEASKYPMSTSAREKIDGRNEVLMVEQLPDMFKSERKVPIKTAHMFAMAQTHVTIDPKDCIDTGIVFGSSKRESRTPNDVYLFTNNSVPDIIELRDPDVANKPVADVCGEEWWVYVTHTVALFTSVDEKVGAPPRHPDARTVI